jgi:hypothetical protein
MPDRTMPGPAEDVDVNAVRGDNKDDAKRGRHRVKDSEEKCRLS